MLHLDPRFDLFWKLGVYGFSLLFWNALGGCSTQAPTPQATVTPAPAQASTEAFFKAVNNNQIAYVQGWLQAGGQVNQTDAQGQTALMVAVKAGHFELAKILLDQGANLHAKNNQGQTALVQATQAKHETAVKWLIEHGANVQDIVQYFQVDPATSGASPASGNRNLGASPKLTLAEVMIEQQVKDRRGIEMRDTILSFQEKTLGTIRCTQMRDVPCLEYLAYLGDDIPGFSFDFKRFEDLEQAKSWILEEAQKSN